jgi:competence protein ComEC
MLMEQIRSHFFLKVYFLNVGQGDAALLKYAGKNILIDGGDRPHQRQPDFVKTIQSFGVHHIDLMVLSHAHADHLYGLVQSLKAMSVSTLLEPGLGHKTELYAVFQKLAKQNHVTVKHPVEGMTVHIGELFTIDILSPVHSISETDLNNHSLVLNVHYRKHRLLFTGDIESAAEKILVEEKPERLKADILKVPHHGSKTSSSFAFLKAVDSKVAVISLAQRNSYGFPHREALKRIEKQTEKIYRTDQDGNIKFLFNRERSIAIPHYQHKWWRFWESE